MTTDAMGCQKEIVRHIVDQGADCLLSLKGNQGNLHKVVELFFQDAKKDGYRDVVRETHTTVDGGHGGVETRTFTVTADVDWFEEKSKWKNLTTFGMVESTREIGDQTTHETRYFISSLPCDAKRFAEAARDHWGVENSLHWCLDISYGEDESRVRSGHAPANLAIIRRFALCLIKQILRGRSASRPAESEPVGATTTSCACLAWHNFRAIALHAGPNGFGPGRPPLRRLNSSSHRLGRGV